MGGRSYLVSGSISCSFITTVLFVSLMALPDSFPLLLLQEYMPKMVNSNKMQNGFFDMMIIFLAEAALRRK
jgi:hypothetical protein